MTPKAGIATQFKRRSSWMLLVPATGWSWLVALLILDLMGVPVRRHHFEAAGIAFGVGSVLFAGLQFRDSRLRWTSLGRREAFVVVAVPAVVAVTAFSWSVGLGPLSDDFVLGRWATTGEWAAAGWSYFRPLPLALWQATIAAGGGATAQHVLNVSVHALNSALVAGLAAGWGGAQAGVVAGVVFALFPASTEAVAWVAGAFDVVSTFFVLVAATLWARRPTTWRTAVLVLCCLGGVLSKESAVVIPLILGVITALTRFGERLEVRQRVWAWTACAMTVGGILALRALSSPAVAGHLATLPVDRRGWKDMIVRPFAALAVPLRTETGITFETYLLTFSLLVVLAAVLTQRVAGDSGADDSPPRSDSLALLSLGGAWCAIGALPLLGQFYVSPTLEGSRYLYLPAVGFALVLSASVSGPVRRTWLPALALMVTIVVYLGALHEERAVWRQAATTRDEVLAQAEVRVRSDHCRTIQILDAPDNVRGAYVFREGLSDAMAGMPFDADGVECNFRWNGASLVGEARADDLRGLDEVTTSRKPMATKR